MSFAIPPRPHRRSALFVPLFITPMPLRSPRNTTSLTVPSHSSHHHPPHVPQKRHNIISNLIFPRPLLKVLSTRAAQSLLLNIPPYLVFRFKPPKKAPLTPAGLNHSFFLGLLLYNTLSWRGYLLCLLLFLAGTLATRVGLARKQRAGIAEARGGARAPKNVWGAAAIPAACAILCYIASLVQHPAILATCKTAYTAAVATKVADTMSSEIGKAYGGVTILLTSGRRVERGTEGGVSLIGSVAVVVGAIAIAAIALGIRFLSSGLDAGVVVVAAVVATTVESVIGAGVQDRWAWSNEFVNFFSTAIGAVCAAALHILVIM